MVIDQHRAHVRILYDRYMDLAQLGAMSTQRVIFPEVLQLSSSQNAIMESIYEEVCAVGFDVSYLGDNSWSINGVPSVIDGVNTKDAILQMIESVTESGEEIGAGLKEKIALSMARAASIKVGQSLTQADMEHLMSDLFKLATPNYTPDGKLVVSIISIDDLHRLFV